MSQWNHDSSLHRLTFAAFVAGLSMLLLGSVLGVASANDPNYGLSRHLPEQIVLPAPLVGDRMEYSLRLYGGADENLVPLQADDRTWRTRMEWREPTLMRDAEGSERYVNLFVVDHVRPKEWQREEAEDRRARAFAYDATTDELVARIEHEESLDRTINYQSDARTVHYYDADEAARLHDRPCESILHDGHGPRVIPLRRSLDLGPCTVGNIADHMPRLRAIATQTWGQETVIVFHGKADRYGMDVRLWLSPSLPYPLRVMLSSRGSPAEHWVLNLDGFDRGNRPLADQRVAAVTLPPIGMAPRLPWGPDDSGIEHPWPLSNAYQHARDDPTYPGLRDFLHAHPEAALVYADYRTHIVRASTVNRTWIFTVSDGEAAHAVCIERQEADPPSPTSAVPLPVQPKYAYNDCSYFQQEAQAQASHVRACGFGTHLPRVADLFARWRHFAATEYEKEEPNYWSITRTYDHDCIGRELIYAGYVGRGAAAAADITSQYSSQRLIRSNILVRDDGKIVGVWEFTADRIQTQQPQRNGTGAPLHVFSANAPVWMIPAGLYVYATLVFSIVAGALYYVWPLLKGGAIYPFFSRIQAPAALNHPTRALLVHIVRQEPGIHLTELARRSELPMGTVRHHVDKLEQAGLLKRRGTRKFSSLFSADVVDRRLLQTAPAVRTAAAQQVLAAVSQEPGLSISQLARRLRSTRQNVHGQVHRLSEAGLLRLERQGRSLAIHPVTSPDSPSY